MVDAEAPLSRRGSVLFALVMLLVIVAWTVRLLVYSA
jgi:hypothetical protein